MIILIGFAFLAGLVTILSPCILPILPIILSSTVGGKDVGKSRPLGVVAGFVLSFTFFTLFLSTLVRLSGVSADFLRTLSVFIIGGFGVSLLIPQFQLFIEKLFSQLSSKVPQSQTRTGFWGGVLLGVSLGLLWTPCVGPILASVISLALTGAVTLDAFLITFAYALGTALPMFGILIGGQHALSRVPWLVRNTARIQKAFGVLMILTAIGIYFQVDRTFQTYILEKFPSYGTGLTKFESNPAVLDILEAEDMIDAYPNPNPDFVGATEWVNSPPLSLNKELKGKVVLVDIWTYTCINCIRTFPYLTSWYSRYKDEGFVIVGVHSPEFEFEKDIDNVRQAMEDFGIEYPVVLDNDFAIWKTYNNRYWPAHYLIDRKGMVRYTHFGEGEYDTTEKMIRKLLEEDGSPVAVEELDMEDMTPKGSRTPETYLGFDRMDRYYKPIDFKLGESVYGLPSDPQLGIGLHRLGFGGKWKVGHESSTTFPGIEGVEESELVIHFEAKEVFLVMRAVGEESEVIVSLDGKPLTAAQAGVDVVNSRVKVGEDRLYKIIRLDTYEQHILRLRFIGEPIEVFAFTFG